MATLTYSRFFGDTIFSFVNRVIGTFFGAVIGMVVWYCFQAICSFIC
jgi:tetrahydromethanopterin S-methyltransferase subunit G